MKKIAILACLLAGLSAAIPASAAACSPGAATAEDPHRSDPPNDYDGVVFGNGSALLPTGDVYREGIDLTGVWMGAVGTDTNRKTKFHIGIQNFAGIESNATYYILFDYENPADPADDLQVRRYVGFSISERGAASGSWGYLDTTGAVGLYTQQGAVTASYTTGPGSVLTISDVPLRRMGNPPSGATLGNLTGETRFLVGARGTGLLFVADSTSDGDGCDSIVV